MLAQDEARTFRHDMIGVEHLVCALTTQSGIAQKALRSVGIDTGSARRRLAEIPATDADIGKSIPFTVEMKTALEMALREALSLGNNYIGVQHVLLGVVRVAKRDPELVQLSPQSDSVLAVDLDALYDAVMRELGATRRLASPLLPPPAPRSKTLTVEERLERIERMLGIGVA